MEIHDLKSVLTDDGIYADVSYDRRRIDAAAHKNDPAHIHDCCEIYFNIAGDVSFSVENTIYPVCSGDMIVTMPNEVHYCIYNTDSLHDYYCLWLRAAEPFQYLLAPFFDRKRGEHNRISLDEQAKARLAGWLDTLLQERDAQKGATVKGSAAILGILDLLNDVKDHTAAPMELPASLKDILAFIEENLDKSCTVQTLCDTFFISRSSIGRLFKHHLGTTPTKYVESKRLALAKLLLEKNISVQAACEKCGFPDYSHFIALFKTRFGVTPLQYKKSHK